MLRNFVRTLAVLALVGAPVACDSGTDPEAIPASINLTADVDVLPAGQTAVLQTVVRDEDDAVIANPDVDFASSNTAIATVDDEGIVTGEGEGEVEITATAGAHTDAVTLFVFEAEDLCNTGLRLIPGEPVRSRLQTGDCVFDDGYLDLYFFELAQQTTVNIELNSDDFDSYLFLYDNAFEVIAQDDNTAGGLDAEILTTLNAGTYWVDATQWPDDDTGDPVPGNYTITLSTSGAQITLEAVRSGARLRTLQADEVERVRRPR